MSWSEAWLLGVLDAARPRFIPLHPAEAAVTVAFSGRSDSGNEDRGNRRRKLQGCLPSSEGHLDAHGMSWGLAGWLYTYSYIFI